MTTNIDLSPSDARETAELLEGFALVLNHPDLPPSVVQELAERLGDVGGARYAMVGDVPMGARFVAQKAREVAATLQAQLSP